MKLNNQKGTSLLLTLLVMAAILSIAIGLARLGLGEIKLLRDIPGSLIAYYAAESGVERALYEAWQPPLYAPQPQPACSVQLANGSWYGTTVTTQVNSTIVQTTGCYQNNKRSIEVSF